VSGGMVVLIVLGGLLAIALVIAWSELGLFVQTLQREWAALRDIKDEVIEFHRTVWEIHREIRRERVGRGDEL